MKYIIALAVIFSCQWMCFSQMTFNTLKHHYGDLNSYDDRFVDITLTNNGVKDGYILTVKKPSEVVYIQSQALVAKGNTLTLRFQVNPLKKGKFNYLIEIYTSDQAEAHKLQLSGNMLEIEQLSQSYLTSCPDFNTLPPGKKANEFDLTVITIDAVTREEVPATKVELIQNGLKLWTASTDKNGSIKKQGLRGFAYFIVEHPKYEAMERGTYLDFNRNRVVIELTNKAVIAEVPPTTPPVTNEPIVTTLVETPIVEVPTVETPSITSTEQPPVIETTVELEELTEDDFNPTFFVPVNVVFVLDVSSSMNQGEKMELMKYSLNQLSEMIRKEDKISLVTYASKAKVLLEPTSGTEKEAVQEQVKTLRASGMTAGGEGIELGFKQAEKAFIPGGINHVFVITDGAFNQKSYNYKKMIGKYTKKNIQLSVVGVLNDQKSEVSMREISALGKGQYVPVFKLNDAKQNIRRVIRKMAFKK